MIKVFSYFFFFSLLDNLKSENNVTSSDKKLMKVKFLHIKFVVKVNNF